jgi:hypothetical protein
MRRRANRAARIGGEAERREESVDFIFECPHCGVISRIPSGHLGETGPCRACGVEVTVPFPEKVETPRKLGRVHEANDRARDDEFEVVDFRRVREAEPARDSTAGGGRTVISSAVLAVLLISAGRAVFSGFGLHNRPVRPPVTAPPAFRDILDDLERDRSSRARSNTGLPESQLSEQEQRAIIEAMRKGKVKPYNPEQMPLAPR